MEQASFPTQPTDPKDLECHHRSCQRLAPFATWEELVDHIVMAHRIDDVCPFCGQEMSRDSLSRHMLTHSQPKHKCFVGGCDAAFNRFDSLATHVLRSHGDMIRRAVAALEDAEAADEAAEAADEAAKASTERTD